MTSKSSSKSRKKPKVNKRVPPSYEIRAELARRHFWEYFLFMDQNAVAGWWQKDLATRLQRFWQAYLDGKRPKLLIFAPPQHGKTRMVVDFIAWASGQRPALRTIYASYSHDLGVDANRMLQRIFDSYRYKQVFPSTRIGGDQVVTLANKPRRNESHIDFVGHAGSFRNTTVGGQVTGKTLDLGVGDDLIKGEEAAHSPTIRDKTWGWYLKDFLTRFDNSAGQIQIGTRWHLDDPLGRMMKEFKDVEVVSYPAIALRDEEHRKEGEPLFPEWKSLEFLMERRQVYSPSAWSSLYQQNPVPDGGAVVKEDWLKTRFRVRGSNPKQIVQSWDCASKAKERNDPTACLTFAVFADHVELWDASTKRQEFPALKRRAIDKYEEFRPNVVLIEDKDAGQQLGQVLKAETKIPVKTINPGTLDKETRMDAESPFLEAGKLWLPEGAPWVSAYVDELTTFPAGAHDDQVDATSQFLKWHREQKKRASKAMPGGPSGSSTWI